MTDAQLFDLIRKDAGKGIAAITREYGGLVYAVISRKLSGTHVDKSEIETCAADTISEFYLDLDKFDLNKGSIKAWLCTIAVHNAVDILRRNMPLSLDEEKAVSEHSPENEFEDREMRRTVLDAVKSLGEPDREIILRKYYLGESSVKIAARLKMTVSNVDTRTSRAVEKLRHDLEDWRK